MSFAHIDRFRFGLWAQNFRELLKWDNTYFTVAALLIMILKILEHLVHLWILLDPK